VPACDHLRLLDALVPAVLAAGRVQMHYYRNGVAVDRKADSSPVTEADRESEAILVAAIGRAAPGVPVVAEEAVSAGQIPTIGDTFFLVDPLDGTREFIEGRGDFTINIALIQDGRPVFGIVYAPALSRFYGTAAADRAVLADVAPDSAAQRLDDLGARRIQAREADPNALVALASRSHLNSETEAWLAQYQVASYKQAGSSLKFCVVAAGEADVYPRLGPTCEWDTAAAHAVLLAAGGRVTTLEGEPLRYGNAAGRFLNPYFIAWGKGIEVHAQG
jgi:3'(2'), 5'-bisphosphate nucleotidase